MHKYAVHTSRHAVTVSGEAGILLLRLWDPLSGALVQVMDFISDVLHYFRVKLSCNVNLPPCLAPAPPQEHLVQPGRPADVVSVQGGRLVMVHFDGSEVQVHL